MSRAERSGHGPLAVWRGPHTARQTLRYRLYAYLLFATGLPPATPESFFEIIRSAGNGWGPPMCTPTTSVRRYTGGGPETVGTLFHHARNCEGSYRDLRQQGFWYCGNSINPLPLPRCSHNPPLNKSRQRSFLLRWRRFAQLVAL